MEDLFVCLANWVIRNGALYNLCYQNDVYEFAIRLTDSGTIGIDDVSELLHYFRHRSDGWFCSVRFDKDCIRLTYAMV